MTQPNARPLTASDDRRWPPVYREDDEISLFDLWGVLVRRKWLLLGVFVVVTLAAAAFAWLKTNQYQYTTTITLGQVLSNDEWVPIEPASAVVARIDQVLLPDAIRSVVGADDVVEFVPDFDVSNPEGSEIIVLSTQGPETRREAYAEIMNTVSGRLAEIHADDIEAAKQQLRLDVEQARIRLGDLQAEKEAVEAQLKRNDEQTNALEQRQQKLQKDAQALRQQRDAAIENDAPASAFLSLNAEITALRDELAAIQERLIFQLPEDRQAATTRLSTLRGEEAVAHQQLAQAQARLQTIRQTEGGEAPSRSFRPTGTGSSLIVALGAVLGLMLGVFVVFFMEFVTRANAHLRREQGPS